MMQSECDPAKARQIEEISINAWPSLSNIVYDGWILRFAAGYGRRANSVNALYPSSLPLEQKIEYCEKAYRDAGLPAIFKVSPAIQPPGLEQHLIGRGYELDAPTAVLVVDLSLVRASMEGPGEPKVCALGEWLPDYGALSGTSGARLATFGEMAARIVPWSAFMRITRDGRAVAAGMAVLERGCVGLYNLEVDAGCRREGLGRQLAKNLMAWGVANGANMAYLFVMRDNVPALALYTGLGFRPVYSYWFRTRSLDSLNAE